MKFWQIWSIVLMTVLFVSRSAQAFDDPKFKTSNYNLQNSIKTALEYQDPAATSIMSTLNEDSLNCYRKEGEIFNFMNLAKGLGANCWEQKAPSIDSNINHNNLLRSDYKICGCLRTAIYGPLKRIMNEKKIEFIVEENDVVKTVKKNAEDLKKELDRDRNLLAFQALVISKENDFAKPFARKAADDDKVQKITNGMKDRVMKKAEELSKTTANNLTADAKDQILKTLQSIEIPPRANSIIFSDKGMKPGQCVDQKEYLSVKQLPLGEEKREIAAVDPNNFKEKDWDYDELRAQYKNFMGMDTADKIQNKNAIISLKAKIRFLDRNPILKTMLSLDSNLPFLEKMDDSQEKKKLVKSKDKIKSEILDKKKELLTIIKNFTVNEDRAGYEQALKKFYVGGKVSEMMDIAIESAALKKIESFASKSFSSDKKKYFTKNSVYADFMERTNLKSPETCHGTDSKVEECVDIYASYCRDLDRIIPNLSSEGEGYMIDDLDELAKNDGEMDIDKNPELQAYNELVCKDFEKFKKEYCSHGIKAECTINTSEYRKRIRKEYFKTKDTTSSTAAAKERKQLERFGKVVDTQSFKSTIDASPDNSGSRFAAFSSLRQNWEMSEDKSSIYAPDVQANPGMGNFASGFENNARSMNSIDNSSVPYQTGIAPRSEPDQKIENMSNNQRREILDDWKKDYQNLPKTSSGAPVPSAEEAALKERISTLEQLLSQQRKLTDDQYNLLNKSISAQNKENDTDEDDEKPSSRRKKKSREEYADADSDQSVDSARSPASVTEAAVPQRTVSSIQGSTVAPSVKRTAAVDPDSSADSVAREEAKLIRLRSNSDGSLTIESVKNGVNTANAITLPVTDEQYKILQTNPDALNLTQIEKKIPKEQIEKLEKNGEIIILMRNGANPPFEVKVEKKNNKLVYRLRDEQGRAQNPVRRVNTLQALGLQFKNQ